MDPTTAAGTTLADRRQSRLLSQPPLSSLNTRRRSSVLNLQQTPAYSASENSKRRSQLSPNELTPPPSATSSSTSWEEKQARRASLAPGSSSGEGGSGQSQNGNMRSSQLLYEEVKGRRGSLLYEEGVKNMRRNSLRQQLEERRSSLLHSGTTTANPTPTSSLLPTSSSTSSNRRQSLFVSDDGTSTLSQRRSSLLFDPRTRPPASRPMEEFADHTTITLAQRRRSSLFPTLGVDSTSKGLLGRLSVALGPSLSPSPNPRRDTREKEKDEERRMSYSLAAMSQAHLLHSRGSRRSIRKNFIRVSIAVLVVMLFTKTDLVRKRYPGVDVLGDWELDDVVAVGGGIQSLIHRPLSTSSLRSSNKQKDTGKERADLPEDWVVQLERDVVGFREEFMWKGVMQEDQLETFVVPQRDGRAHEETVIFLHGLAQTYYDSMLPSQLGERFPNVKWVMPQAPLKPISVRNDTTHAWFNMLAFPYSNAQDEDPSNLFFSTRQINSIIASERSLLIAQLRSRGGLERLSWEERKGYTFSEGDDEEVGDGEIGTRGERKWAGKRIVLAGFSQGSVMSMLVGLTGREELAGIVLLSSFMPLRRSLRVLVRDLDRKEIPIFWGHGQEDIYLEHEDALVSIELLKSQEPNRAGLGGLGLQNIEFHSYPGLGHTWFPGEMDHLAEWLRRVLPVKVGRG